MTRTRWATALAATALLAGLTACSGDASSTAAPSQDSRHGARPRLLGL